MAFKSVHNVCIMDHSVVGVQLQGCGKTMRWHSMPKTGSKDCKTTNAIRIWRTKANRNYRRCSLFLSILQTLVYTARGFQFRLCKIRAPGLRRTDEWIETTVTSCTSSISASFAASFFSCLIGCFTRYRSTSCSTWRACWQRCNRWFARRLRQLVHR